MNKWSRRFEGNYASAKPAGRRRAPAQAHYFAFLSYSHNDSQDADWLHEQLERFRVPSTLRGRVTATGVVPKRLTPIFRDQHDLAAGDDLNEEICEALEASRCLLVLCSPAAARSKWINVEIETFKRIHPEGAIIAAVIAGEPLASDIPGREDEECFPPALVAKYNRRGRPTGKKTEPLAADLREGKGGRRTGFLKIVAGMLGVGLDELVQREATRRHRQLAYVAAASLAGMAITSTLAITAFEARNSAREQRREAEGLVEFMLGDLRAKLEPIGRLDALDGVGSRVLAYYSKQDTSDLPDAALLQRSQALNLMAEVAFNRGNMAEAEGLYRQAMAGTAEAVRRSPKDPERIFQHAQNVFYVGEVARFAGQPSQAEAAYREYKRLADQMIALQPDSIKYRMEILYSNENLGISLYDQHRFEEAARQFQGAAAPIQGLAALYPNNTSYQKEVATVLAWTADTARSQGNFQGAIAARQRQVSTLERIVASAADSDARARLIIAHEALGLVLVDAGQSNRGIQELQSAVAEAEDLIPVEPRNAQWKSMAGDARLALATTLLSLNRTEEAAQQTQAGCGLGAGLPAAYATSKAHLNGICASLRARLALKDGATQQALALAQQALAATRSEHGEDPISDRYRIAIRYRLLGDIQNRAGNPAAAQAAWSAGLGGLPANVAERPIEMNERLQLLQRLGRVNEAAPLAARLKAIGYRGAA